MNVTLMLDDLEIWTEKLRERSYQHYNFPINIEYRISDHHCKYDSIFHAYETREMMMSYLCYLKYRFIMAHAESKVGTSPQRLAFLAFPRRYATLTVTLTNTDREC